MQKMRVPPHFSLISFVKVFVVGGIASEIFPSPIYKAYGVFKLFGIFAVYCVGFILSYDDLNESDVPNRQRLSQNPNIAAKLQYRDFRRSTDLRRPFWK